MKRLNINKNNTEGVVRFLSQPLECWLILTRCLSGVRGNIKADATTETERELGYRSKPFLSVAYPAPHPLNSFVPCHRFATVTNCPKSLPAQKPAWIDHLHFLADIFPVPDWSVSVTLPMNTLCLLG